MIRAQIDTSRMGIGRHVRGMRLMFESGQHTWTANAVTVLDAVD